MAALLGTALYWSGLIFLIPVSLSPLWLQLLWPPGPGSVFPLDTQYWQQRLTAAYLLEWTIIELYSHIAKIRSKHFLRIQNWHLEHISVHNEDCNFLSAVKCNLLGAKQWTDILTPNAELQIIVNNGEGSEGVRNWEGGLWKKTVSRF